MRFPCPHVHQSWPQKHQCAACPGPEASCGLISPCGSSPSNAFGRPRISLLCEGPHSGKIAAFLFLSPIPMKVHPYPELVSSLPEGLGMRFGATGPNVVCGLCLEKTPRKFLSRLPFSLLPGGNCSNPVIRTSPGGIVIAFYPWANF